MRVKAFSEDYQLKVNENQVEGPSSPREFMEWNIRMRNWRLEQLKKKECQVNAYDDPKLQWSQISYVQPHVMINDLYLFNPKANKFTVEKYLRDAEGRYGKIDSVVVWPTFSNLGCDSRNSEDYFRCIPGGTIGIRALVEDFHAKDVKVLFPIAEWDNGTRHPQAAWSYILPRLFKEYNLDGMCTEASNFSEDYLKNSLAIGHPLVFNSFANGDKNSDNTNAVQWNSMDMVRFDTKSRVPSVATKKYVDSKHMTHASAKWCKSKNSLVQLAFFNGIGVEIMENIFGVWNQLAPRDAEALRRVSSILRCFGPDFFASSEWEPHTPCVRWETVFSSKFPSRVKSDQIVWTFINKGPAHVTGHQIVVNYHIGLQFYDVWHGKEIFPSNIVDGLATLSFDIEPYGYGCIFATCDVSPLPTNFDVLIKTLRQRSETPLCRLPISSTILWQELDEVTVSPYDDETCGMVRIEGDMYDFTVTGLGSHPSSSSEYPGVDVRYPWEFQPSRKHNTYRMKINTFYMDAYPVTESQFKEFMDATNYKPVDPTNFLKHWIGGCYPSYRANKPVTHVSIEDARAYAKWAGKRLPHEWEWQFVAQAGCECRIYPWGNEWDDKYVPEAYTGRERLYPDHPPADVDANPLGRSPFGVYDLVGNVWQWTDVYQDQRSRSAVIRGGSYYRPQDTDKYFPQAYRNDQHSKYLLMSPSVDRCATIGFRCVKDTAESAAASGNCAFVEEHC
ncbi:hypothetical protein BDB01DRAFT_749455 [Pilobolus umbonatus]|nr:hypothetical protein BDB01DRAFT_749455 [Pilobolus umbonatus]